MYISITSYRSYHFCTKIDTPFNVIDVLKIVENIVRSPFTRLIVSLIFCL